MCWELTYCACTCTLTITTVRKHHHVVWLVLGCWLTVGCWLWAVGVCGGGEGRGGGGVWPDQASKRSWNRGARAHTAPLLSCAWLHSSGDRALIVCCGCAIMMAGRWRARVWPFEAGRVDGLLRSWITRGRLVGKSIECPTATFHQLRFSTSKTQINFNETTIWPFGNPGSEPGKEISTWWRNFAPNQRGTNGFKQN